jgi:hypothetical protein
VHGDGKGNPSTKTNKKLKNQKASQQGIMYKNDTELNNALVYWAAVLRLSDWRIKGKLVRAWDLDYNKQGSCKWTLSRKEAHIKIMDTLDYDPDFIYPQDQEEVLVHELLHLHFAPFDKFDLDTLEGVAIEQAIQSIAAALIKVHREKSDGDGLV